MAEWISVSPESSLSPQSGCRHFPPDDNTIDHLTAAKELQFLGLFGQKLTGNGFAKVAAMSSLQYLAVDIPKVSRNVVEELRRARPDLTVQVEPDMRRRPGPV